MHNAPQSTNSRLAKALGLAASIVGSTLASTAHAQLVYNVWETWEGSTNPVFGGTGGADDELTHATLANSPTHYYHLGMATSTWWSIGRTFTPPAGSSCFAFGVRKGDNDFASLDAQLEVIDSDTWTLVKTKAFTITSNQAWTWVNTQSLGAWTADGGNVFVRMVLFGSFHGGNGYFDDIVVQCS
jgi:hypothetical protein